MSEGRIAGEKIAWGKPREFGMDYIEDGKQVGFDLDKQGWRMQTQ